jgi:hypothetical protein
MKINTEITTSGDGLWSTYKTNVKCINMNVGWQGKVNDVYDGLVDFGELQVAFDTDSWNPNKVGLIYTDTGWLSGFRKYLQTLGFSLKAVWDVDYSEQGMQGEDYVSLDVGKFFLKEWNTVNKKRKSEKKN